MSNLHVGETFSIKMFGQPMPVKITEIYNNGHEEYVAYSGPRDQKWTSTVEQFNRRATPSADA